MDDSQRMNVAIIGTGYVGLTTGVCLAFLGHSVCCLDVDEKKVERLREGKIPIYERWLEELLEEAREHLRFTSSYEDAIRKAQVVFIAVGTPPQADGSPDLRYLRSAAQSIGAYVAQDFTVVVNK